jgi:hypothetical protein
VPPKPQADEQDEPTAESKDGDESDDEPDGETTIPKETDDIDEDKAEYNKVTITASVEAAFSDIEERFGVVVSQSDRRAAQQLLPKVCGHNQPLIHR